jgi:hypothetical protein
MAEGPSSPPNNPGSIILNERRDYRGHIFFARETFAFTTLASYYVIDIRMIFGRGENAQCWTIIMPIAVALVNVKLIGTDS